MKPTNIKEFKQLIERYESITLEEIKKVEMKYEYYNPLTITIPEFLTKFGSWHFCILCKNIRPISSKCKPCVYNKTEKSQFACNEGKNKETYQAILKASNADELLAAYKARARHMRQILIDLNLD